jgi:ribosomal protein L37AE/L43A
MSKCVHWWAVISHKKGKTIWKCSKCGKQKGGSF